MITSKINLTIIIVLIYLFGSAFSATTTLGGVLMSRLGLSTKTSAGSQKPEIPEETLRKLLQSKSLSAKDFVEYGQIPVQLELEGLVEPMDRQSATIKATRMARTGSGSGRTSKS